MKYKHFFIGLVIFNFSCTGFSPTAPIVDDIAAPVIDSSGNPVIVSKDPVINFKTDLKVQNIELNDSETKEVALLKITKPVGRWAISENSTALNNLENNFNTFKSTFVTVPKDSTEYMTNAIKFANSVNYYARFYFDTEYYKQTKKVLLVKWDPQTTEFIIIHSDGRVSNYQMTNKINAPRYILVPDVL